MTILIILVTMQKRQSKTYDKTCLIVLLYLYLTMQRCKTLSELKAWFFSYSHFLAMIAKALLNTKLQRHAPKKEEKAVPFV